MSKTTKALLAFLLGAALVLGILGTALAQEPHCKGITVKGQPCQSVIGLKDGYCRVHNPNTPRCGAMTSKKQPCKMVVDKVGDRCRFHQGK